MERLPSRGQSARGGVSPPQARGGCVAAGTNFPTVFFLRLSPIGGSGWEPSTAKVSEVEADPRKQGGGCAKAGTNFPTAFFLRLSPVGGSGWKPSTAKVSKVGYLLRKQGGGCVAAGTNFPTAFFFCGCRLSAAAAGSHPTDDGKIHRAAGVRLVGFEGSKRPQAFGWSGSSSGGSKIHRERRQNPPPPQVFSWSGSSSSEGKTHRADGKIHRRRRCSAGRAAAAARAAKRQQGSAGRVRGQQNGSRVRLVGFEGSKTAAGFSCSGSISSGDKSTVDDGKIHRRRRRSAVRAPSAARAAKRPQAFGCSGSISSEGSKTAAGFGWSGSRAAKRQQGSAGRGRGRKR